MSTIQIIDKETISNKEYPLKFITFQKPDLDGNLHKQENEIYFRPDAVSVLLVDEKRKKFLLTRQFRLPTFLNGNDTGYLVETCAGLIDEDEMPEQGARREVEEETGYQVDDLTKIGGVYSSAGGLTEYLHLFIARLDLAGRHSEGGGLKEEGEDIQLIEMPIDEAREKLKLGEFRDAKTIILLQHYFLQQ